MTRRAIGAMWRALPAYLGGKRRLCPLIFREIDAVIPRRLWPSLTFLDGFLGGGAVSLYAKAQGFRVHAIDIAERSVIVGQALIANSQTHLSGEWSLRAASRSEKTDPGGPLGGAPHESDPKGPVSSRCVPSVFTPNVGDTLDRLLAAAGAAHDVATAALLRLVAIKLAMQVHPMSQVRAGTTERAVSGAYEAITDSCVKHFVDALTITRPKALRKLIADVNAGVFPGIGTVEKGDVLERLPAIKADVAYFDPPYPGTTPYEKEYRVLDAMLGDAARPVSPWSHRDGTGLIDTLLDRSRHIPLVVLSFGNAVASLSDMEHRMTRFGRRTRALAIPYAHKANVARKESQARNRELLVLGSTRRVSTSPSRERSTCHMRDTPRDGADTRMIPLERLRAHPLNSNVMPEDLLEKLTRNIKRTGRYPHLIVRPHPKVPGDYEVLDGHHRIRVLRDLGHTDARCDVWDVDDREAKVLLATLNRLEGQDQPLRRAQLLHELLGEMGTGDLSALVPESEAAIRDLHTLLEFPTDDVTAQLAANAQAEDPTLPQVLTFVVRTDHADEILRAVDAASDGLQGRDRKGRGLLNLARHYLDETREREREEPTPDA